MCIRDRYAVASNNRVQAVDELAATVLEVVKGGKLVGQSISKVQLVFVQEEATSTATSDGVAFSLGITIVFQVLLPTVDMSGFTSNCKSPDSILTLVLVPSNCH